MKFIKTLLAILLTISLFGCQTNKPKEVEEMNYEKSVITNINDFDFEVFHKLYNEKKNLVYSPLSLKIALVMAANGADEDTLKEFEKTFGLSLEELNKQISLITKSLAENKGDTTLSLANSIWVSDQFQVLDSYLDTLVNEFDAQVFNRDLTTSQTLKELNNWVSDKTNGLIKSIREENFTKDHLAAIINALYLKAKWSYPFEDTHTRNFHALDQDVPVEMMTMQARLEYLNNEKYQGVILPYNDNKTVMIGIMGNQLENFTREDLNALLETRETFKTNVSLPRFEIEAKYNLVEILKSCGIEKAFDQENANFKKLGTVNPDENIYISEVIQKAKIKVDQDGTEAAAVTMIGFAKATAMPIQEEIKTIVFDRPFIYLVMDETTNTILFMGMVNNPNL